MKKLLLCFIALSTLASANASCTQYEAQIWGGVVINTIKNDNGCFIELDIDQMYENVLCPLARVDIELSRIKDKKCKYKLGDSISAIIIQSDKKYLEIDE